MVKSRSAYQQELFCRNEVKAGIGQNCSDGHAQLATIRLFGL
ncbi:hypothetical protein PRJ_5543 (plasmid) [Pseudomonas sp. XWY-1]|nr:hypothetical protein PRJ_5543 [Pseudomonas sp. XWY-1]